MFKISTPAASPAILLLALVLMPLIPAAPALAQEAPAAAEGLWTFLEAALPAWGVAGLLILRQVAELAAKAIPDSAAGWPGVLRRIFKFLALYIPNRR